MQKDLKSLWQKGHRATRVINTFQSLSASEIYASAENAAAHLCQFCEEASGSVLRAWLRVFDESNAQSINKMEFSGGLAKLKYTGDPFKLFKALDDDDSNELTLDELDSRMSSLWADFRVFCVLTVRTPEELLQRCAHLAGAKPPVTHISKEMFCTACEKLGWIAVETLPEFFNAMSLEMAPDVLDVSGLQWLTLDIQRHDQKEAAKKASEQWLAVQRKLSKSPKECRDYYESFLEFLKRKHGNLVRAWRVSLSRDSMAISKLTFLTACANLGFAKDSKELWNMLDKDKTGTARMEELDPTGTVALARFKAWMDDHFANSQALFQEMDIDNNQHLSHRDFYNFLSRHNCPQVTDNHLFDYFDSNAQGRLKPSDLAFLDRWDPSPFLLAKPSTEAMASVKSMLLERCESYFVAWRELLDPDGSGRCAWEAFEEACTTLGFKGDVAGAWRAFDSNVNGYISFADFDEVSAMELCRFQRWVTREFGSAKSFFKVLDTKGLNALVLQEFRKGLRFYGYPAHYAKPLFLLLDMDNAGVLTERKFEFLDGWDLELDVSKLAAEKGDEEVAGRNFVLPSSRPRKSFAKVSTDQLPNSTSNGDNDMRLREVMKRHRQLQDRAQMGSPQFAEGPTRPASRVEGPTRPASRMEGRHVYSPAGRSQSGEASPEVAGFQHLVPYQAWKKTNARTTTPPPRPSSRRKTNLRLPLTARPSPLQLQRQGYGWRGFAQPLKSGR
eukprot:TRINITY_DN7998_c0_g1_i1.p1 TRINITY_DN7998_c0_g1~~TRINITY_DN7998_c0_g1_i1.p1  ORF type:complete len:744 (-),score=140.32 TRINITY_DN7998_c0_g1_i1:72-2255(-)